MEDMIKEEQKLVINKPAPDFTTNALIDGEAKTIKLSDYKGKWVVLFFYPGDFTFVCPTELGDLADKYPKLKEMDVEVMSVSTDTSFVHKAWQDTSDTIKKIKFPMISDPTGKICRAYGTYIDAQLDESVEDEGQCLRGTFIINPDGILKAYEIHANNIGRSGEELFRKIQAAQFVHENGSEVCPMNWKPGEKTLKPGMDLVGKI